MVATALPQFSPQDRYRPAPMEAAVVAWMMQHDERDPNAYVADLFR
jgi:hypothetical protein